MKSFDLKMKPFNWFLEARLNEKINQKKRRNEKNFQEKKKKKKKKKREK
jgi:hypothetical protein